MATRPNGFQSALTICVFSLALFAFGCGGEDSGDADKGTANASSASRPAASTATAEPKSDTTGETVADKKTDAEPAVAGIGSLTGRIIFGGDAPTLEPLVKSGDPDAKDAPVCAAHDVPNETILVGDDGGLANVFVYMRKAPKGFKATVPTEPVVIDQQGCRFFPRASFVQVGQTVQIVSDDEIQHNVHTFPNRNQGVNVLISAKDRKGIEVTYKSAESEPFQIKCDIHAWMSAFQIAVDHPFAQVTDANGNFTIEGIPAGTHEFRIWHEKSGFLERKLEVEIKADQATELNLTFADAKFADAAVRTNSVVLNDR